MRWWAVQKLCRRRRVRKRKGTRSGEQESGERTGQSCGGEKRLLNCMGQRGRVCYVRDIGGSSEDWLPCSWGSAGCQELHTWEGSHLEAPPRRSDGTEAAYELGRLLPQEAYSHPSPGGPCSDCRAPSIHERKSGLMACVH